MLRKNKRRQWIFMAEQPHLPHNVDLWSNSCLEDFFKWKLLCVLVCSLHYTRSWPEKYVVSASLLLPSTAVGIIFKRKPVSFCFSYCEPKTKANSEFMLLVLVSYILSLCDFKSYPKPIKTHKSPTLLHLVAFFSLDEYTFWVNSDSILL